MSPLLCLFHYIYWSEVSSCTEPIFAHISPPRDTVLVHIMASWAQICCSVFSVADHSCYNVALKSLPPSPSLTPENSDYYLNQIWPWSPSKDLSWWPRAITKSLRCLWALLSQTSSTRYMNSESFPPTNQRRTPASLSTLTYQSRRPGFPFCLNHWRGILLSIYKPY